MKKFIISVLLALISITSFSQNGGQANENSVIRIDYTEYSSGNYTFKITNKQPCSVSAQYQIYHNPGLVDIIISANGIYTVLAPGTLGEFVSVKAKAVSFCSSVSPDHGWVETNNTAVVLPLKLISFNVVRTRENKCTVSWATAEEIGIDRFEIEKSFDGINYSTIALAFPNNRPSSYSLSCNMNSRIEYFRLKAIENDRKIYYSNVVRIINEQISDKLKVYVIDGGSTLVVESKSLFYTIMDLAGRSIMNYSVSNANSKVSIPIYKLETGVYFIRSSDGYSSKFLK